MPTIRTSLATLRALVMGLAVPLAAQQPGPCDQITAACQSAGFVKDAGSTGNGLQVDCVFPIMRGTAQPTAAVRPLPTIDPQTVTACKTRHPDFGQAKGTAPSTLVRPAPASTTQPLASQPSTPTPVPSAATAQLTSPPSAALPTPPGATGVADATSVGHFTDKSLPELAPDPGSGSLAVQMQNSSGVYTSLGNATSGLDNGTTHTVEIQFPKNNQEAYALGTCLRDHCIMRRVTITQMAHSGGKSTPTVVYTLTDARVAEFVHNGPYGKPNEGPWLAVVGYLKITAQYPPHSH